MLCELCHKEEAAGVLHRKDADGEDEDIYVCKKCLADANGSAQPETEDEPNGEESSEDEPPAFIKNFLDAAAGLIEGVVRSEPPKETTCPVCGRTWSQIKETGLVGCADCWAQFGKSIRAEFLKGAYGPRHMGMIPEKTSDGKPSRAFLEKELKEAVKRQNFRKAAQLRRMLDEMNGGAK